MRPIIKKTACAVAAALLASACGEPDGPTSPRWRIVGSLNTLSPANGLAPSDTGTVYIVGRDNDGKATVVKYDGTALSTSFVSPFPDSEFFSACSGGDALWAAGTRQVGLNHIAYAVIKTGEGPWEEIAIPPELGLEYVGPVFYHPSGEFLICGSAGGERYIYRVDEGEWLLIRTQRNVKHTSFVMTAKGRVFNYIVAEREAGVLVSDDAGATWVREDLPMAYGTYQVKPEAFETVAIAAAGDGLALSVPLDSTLPKFELDGVIMRDGSPPGQGRYTLAFASPHGPWFWDIRALAFRTAEEGYAVGLMTSVHVKNNQWELDLIPEQWSPEFSLATAGPTGYWAIANTAAVTNDPTLYYAPF